MQGSSFPGDRMHGQSAEHALILMWAPPQLVLTLFWPIPPHYLIFLLFFFLPVLSPERHGSSLSSPLQPPPVPDHMRRRQRCRCDRQGAAVEKTSSRMERAVGEPWNLGVWGWDGVRRRRGGKQALGGLEEMSGAAVDRRRSRLERAVRRGGRASAADRGRRRQAVRPVVEARAERASSSPVALHFFIFSGGRRCFSVYSSPFHSDSTNCIFDRRHGHP
jgi:hypothetical protein